jgi:hypothetical protein
VSVVFEALWDALCQYVENTGMIEGELRESTNPRDARELSKLAAARAMLGRMDAAVIATAGQRMVACEVLLTMSTRCLMLPPNNGGHHT